MGTHRRQSPRPRFTRRRTRPATSSRKTNYARRQPAERPGATVLT
jgi:hypothetical protein